MRTWGAGVLRAYKDKKNPRTDLKIGHYKRKKEAARLIAPAAVNDVNCAGGIGRFVGREVNRQMGDFLRSADAAHRLARNEGCPCRHGIGIHIDALFEGGRFHGSGADGVDSDSVLHDIGCQATRQADHGALGGAVHKAVGRSLDAGGDRGHVDDAAAAAFDHGGQKRAN